MSLANITFKEITDLVYNYIITKCNNITNFDSIPAVFKVGYSRTGSIPRTGPALSNPRYTIRITRFVSKETKQIVAADFNSFLNIIGVTPKLNDIVSENEFISLVNNMISFCSTKLCFATSQYSSNKYLIYMSTNTRYAFTENIPTKVAKRLIFAEDVNQIINILFDITKQIIRNAPCQYTISLLS